MASPPGWTTALTADKLRLFLNTKDEEVFMVTLSALWLPILLAAVAVFIASSVIHMALRYHSSEYRQLPGEAELLEAMRSAKVGPGFYSFPYAGSRKEMGTPEMREKYELGPMGTANIVASGLPNMGKALSLWFAFSLLVGLFAAYLASRTIGAGAHYLQVFRVVGTVAFLGYGLAHLSDGIWQQKPWSMVLKHVFDGLVYALLTAGIFGWLWP
jgi:hypothetical protein